MKKKKELWEYQEEYYHTAPEAAWLTEKNQWKNLKQGGIFTALLKIYEAALNGKYEVRISIEDLDAVFLEGTEICIRDNGFRTKFTNNGAYLLVSWKHYKRREEKRVRFKKQKKENL